MSGRATSGSEVLAGSGCAACHVGSDESVAV